MNKNETVIDFPVTTTERQSPAQSPEKPSSGESAYSTTASLDGRMEKRVQLAVPVDLLISEEMLIAERVVTVNVSPHGARVVTKRHWRVESGLGWLL